jgi:hypothetical protein
VVASSLVVNFTIAVSLFSYCMWSGDLPTSSTTAKGTIPENKGAMEGKFNGNIEPENSLVRERVNATQFG